MCFPVCVPNFIKIGLKLPIFRRWYVKLRVSVRICASTSVTCYRPTFRGSFTAEKPNFLKIVIVCNWRAEMDVKIEPIDLWSSEMAWMTSLNECNKIRLSKPRKLSSGSNGSPTRIFGGYVDERKVENLTENQHSPISTKMTSSDGIWWVQQSLMVFNAYLPWKLGVLAPKRSLITPYFSLLKAEKPNKLV